MVWQDIAIAIDAFVLAIAIVPLMWNKRSKVPLIASVPTAVGLAIITFLFLTLGLVISALSTGMETGMWVFIIFRRRLKPEPFSENKNSESKKVDIEFSGCEFDGMTCTEDCVQPCQNPKHGIMLPGQGDGVGIGP